MKGRSAVEVVVWVDAGARVAAGDGEGLSLRVTITRPWKEI